MSPVLSERAAVEQLAAAVAAPATPPALCKRTVALWKPGEPQAGVYCRLSWSGRMPLTGRLRCTLCGEDAATWVIERAGARYLVEASDSIIGGRIVRQL